MWRSSRGRKGLGETVAERSQVGESGRCVIASWDERQILELRPVSVLSAN